MFYVYILTNKYNTVLYTGVTGKVEKRLVQHFEIYPSSFCSQYRVSKLVYLESYESSNEAISREKQIKGWRRERKIDLIESLNPEWESLLS